MLLLSSQYKCPQGYELSVPLSWEGETKDSDGVSLLKVDGTVEIMRMPMKTLKLGAKKESKKNEGFSYRVMHLYEILMDENRWKGFTQSNAKISKLEVGKGHREDGRILFST
ncbi:hypothetical protein QYF36_021868 [Acer negundo]|nr:hypothetical protein QYF36_021868 [Acer negundo]